ncbi:uncharacterized protein LOC111345898 [Stylophora pistillata]|uniref:uncharacterized protein LOC111345898 n=1 Tax=Stylophora pistillata TaxID=50429 RepID=UPI000C0520D7|nr:uncharacterized protein LOC111345898 [Stylophora pistillata]
MSTAHAGQGLFRIICRLQVKESPKFTLTPPAVVFTVLRTNISLSCEATGSRRPKVKWSWTQRSSAAFTFLQEDGCLLINMAEYHIKEYFICRATDNLGAAETVTTLVTILKVSFISFFTASHRGLGLSVILASNDNHLETLSSWLRSVERSQSSQWKRCWRASVDGWAASTFHSLCDKKGLTVTIIRVGRYIFGGYAGSGWTSPSSCTSQHSRSTFLFSLVNKPGWGPVKLSQTGKYGSHGNSILTCSSYAPTFGGGYDIYIANYASSNTQSFANLGYTYSPPSGHSYGSSFTRSFLAGSYKFQPDEVEVFYETT